MKTNAVSFVFHVLKLVADYHKYLLAILFSQTYTFTSFFTNKWGCSLESGVIFLFNPFEIFFSSNKFHALKSEDFQRSIRLDFCSGTISASGFRIVDFTI